MRLAIVPARSGSTRIKNKNIYPVNGKPMISFPLAAARESDLFDEIHVSTDSPEYARLVEDLGFSVPFLRSAEMSRNQSSVFDTQRWVIKEFEKRGKYFDEISLIYATAVLITAEDLRAAYEAFQKTDKANSMVAVATYPAPIERTLVKAEDGLTLNWIWPEKRLMHSQDCETGYFDAGAFTHAMRHHLFNHQDDIPLRYYGYNLPRWKVSDINDMEDLMVAEILMRGRERVEK